MGISGLKFNPDKVKLIETIKKRKGLITYVCKDLKIHYQTLKKYIDKDDELTQLLEECRKEYSEFISDLCESKLVDHISQKEDRPTSLKAIMFALNNKARERGYGKNFEESTKPPYYDLISAQNENIALRGELLSLKEDLDAIKRKTDPKLPPSDQEI